MKTREKLPRHYPIFYTLWILLNFYFYIDIWNAIGVMIDAGSPDGPIYAMYAGLLTISTLIVYGTTRVILYTRQLEDRPKDETPKSDSPEAL